ncbi:unnamed protein product [Paramecium sonneborni]|uniref:Uncharacterized protein n=1 Tax=Paramecium sonneborni TaxID=65129 RepID=A0A8S1MCS2_9CILI|nr:unnamed protein product [Paramecium sonneborni]
MQQQQQTQKSQNPTDQKKNKIGKPKGMNSQKPLDKTYAWSSNQQSTQAVQTLTRLGRFICFQQTGSKRPALNQNIQNIPGIFLNNIQIQIAKNIGEWCQITHKSNKNAVVFFFSSTHPEFQIIDGIPFLKNNYEQFGNYPPLQKLAPMLNWKFLNEYFQYLEFQNGQSQIYNIQSFFYQEKNKILKQAETILQCLFTKYLIFQLEETDLQDKSSDEQNLESQYQEFYNKPETKQDYENCVKELLACMQIEEEFDQQYECN